MAQKAVIRSYEILGEITKRLPDEFRNHHPEIEWHKLAAFRDYLTHRYDTVDLGRVWVAVQDVARVRAMLAKLLDEYR